MKVIIGVPVTERGVRRLSRALHGIAEKYGSIALPLPRSLCMKVIVNYSEALTYALNLMNPSIYRIWHSLLITLRDLVLSHPNIDIGCYASEETYTVSRDLGYSIAILAVKARAYNIVKPEEWLEVFRKPPRPVVSEVMKYNAIVADGYSWMLRLKEEIKPEKVLVADTMIPTPLDILELMALGYLNTSMVKDVVNYAIKYVGEYIVTSFTLTQAYNKLLKDSGYLELLGKLKLEIYDTKMDLEWIERKQSTAFPDPL